jgi:predicted ArsR family transcriptional regulator
MSLEIQARKKQVLEFLQTDGDLTIEEVMERLDLPRTTTRRVLDDLELEEKVWKYYHSFNKEGRPMAFYTIDASHCQGEK